MSIVDVVLQTANLLKKIEAYEDDAKEKLKFVQNELKDPKHPLPPGMSQDEKILQMQKIENGLKELLTYLAGEKEKLKDTLEEVHPVGEVIVETAKTFNNFFR